MIALYNIAVVCLLLAIAVLAEFDNDDEIIISFPVRQEDCVSNYGQKIANPQDCRVYFECNNPLRYEVCSFGKYFNGVDCSLDSPPDGCTTSWIQRHRSSHSRNIPTNPTKSLSTTLPPDTVTPSADRASPCHDMPDGYTFKTSDAKCDTYAVCWRGIAHTGQCPRGYSYNGVASVCDISNNHRCEPSAMCPPTGIYAFRELGNCSAYNFCFAGVHLTKLCTNGLQFDARQQRCAQPEVAKCFECPVVDDAATLVMFRGQRCDEYYICQNTEVVLFKCSAGLHWNKETQMCDVPKNAGCVAQ